MYMDNQRCAASLREQPGEHGSARRDRARRVGRLRRAAPPRRLHDLALPTCRRRLARTEPGKRPRADRDRRSPAAQRGRRICSSRSGRAGGSICTRRSRSTFAPVTPSCRTTTPVSCSRSPVSNGGAPDRAVGADQNGAARPRTVKRWPSSSPSTCRSSTRSRRTTSGGARASPSGRTSPRRARSSRATTSRTCRRTSASTTCGCPRRARRRPTLARDARHPRLLLLPLLVRREAAARAAVRRGARVGRARLPVLPLLGERAVVATLGRARRRRPPAADLQPEGRPRAHPLAAAGASPTRARHDRRQAALHRLPGAATCPIPRGRSTSGGRRRATAGLARPPPDDGRDRLGRGLGRDRGRLRREDPVPAAVLAARARRRGSSVDGPDQLRVYDYEQAWPVLAAPPPVAYRALRDGLPELGQLAAHGRARWSCTTRRPRRTSEWLRSRGRARGRAAGPNRSCSSTRGTSGPKARTSSPTSGTAARTSRRRAARSTPARAGRGDRRRSPDALLASGGRR